MTVGGNPMPSILTGSATLSFGTVAAGNENEQTFSVTGATPGSLVALGIPDSAETTGTVYHAWVSAADTVTVKLSNVNSIGPVTINTQIFKIAVFQ